MMEQHLRLAMTAATRVTRARIEYCILIVLEVGRPATGRLIKMIVCGLKKEKVNVNDRRWSKQKFSTGTGGQVGKRKSSADRGDLIFVLSRIGIVHGMSPSSQTRDEHPASFECSSSL